MEDALHTLLVVVVVFVVFVLPFVAVVICLLKGKFWMALFGFFVALVALVGAIRLAKPDSYWGKRYGPRKSQLAISRYSDMSPRW